MLECPCRSFIDRQKDRNCTLLQIQRYREVSGVIPCAVSRLKFESNPRRR